ncbi:hypothetical protein BX600DRAFT_471680 [Xylariales sp. PMI_506]|nr:hypothetical protein BX600DRAFT_471680 [Xylariales sp. PMI_506]
MSSPFDLFHRLKVKETESNIKITLTELFKSSQNTHISPKPSRILIRGRTCWCWKDHAMHDNRLEV